jgi:DegV family protein with EDD domain
MDLGPKQMEAIHIHQVPLKIELDNKTYLSGVDINADEFYELLTQTNSMPKTSLPSPGDFVTLYEKLVEEHPEDKQIFSIHISSGLSNTLQSAQTAAGLVPRAEVSFFDTMTLSGAQGWQVEAAARAAQAGWAVDKIKELVEKVRKVTETIYTLPDLKYLINGGRISHMKGLLASVLRIKPIIGVDKTEGKYYERSKQPTFKRALRSLVNVVANDIPEGSAIRVQACSTANPEGIELVRAELNKRFDCHWLSDSTVAPVLGAHTGLGLVGLVYAPLADYPALP